MCSLAIYYRQASSFMQELILIVHQYLSICPMRTKQSLASATHIICSASWWTAEEAHGSALTPTPASTKTVTHQVSAHKSNYFPQARTFTMYSSWNKMQRLWLLYNKVVHCQSVSLKVNERAKTYNTIITINSIVATPEIETDNN